MEPIIKSEPCEYLYNEQNIANQVSVQMQRCETTLQERPSQNNLKRVHEEWKDTSENGKNICQQQRTNHYESIGYPSVAQNAQSCFDNRESIQPTKKYKRLEENVLFNPPFFNLVKDSQSLSSKDTIAARCYSCDKVVKGNRGISSNFIKHMKRGHPEIYKLYDGYKSHKIKSCHLPSLAKIIDKKYIPVMENGATGSDSTAANSNDDTYQCFDANTVLESSCLNDSSDDNDDSVTATKETSETNNQLEFPVKNLEELSHVIDDKMKAYVKQTEYKQLYEHVNSLTNRYITCDVDANPALTDLKIELDNLKKECSELRSDIQKSRAGRRQLQNELRTVEKQLYQRKLIIRNIPVSDLQNPLQSVEKLFKETMNLCDIKILNCCIIPSFKAIIESNRENISIELATSDDCKTILRQTRRLKHSGIFVESETSPFQRRRKNKLIVLRKELLRRKPDLKVIVRDTTLLVNGKSFYWDDVEGLCHECKSDDAININGVDYMKSLCNLDLKEFTVVLQNYNVQTT